MTTAALVIAAKLALGLVVEGQVSCPTPALVAAEAAPLLPEDFGEADARLRLTQVDGWGGGEPTTWIRLELFDASGELVASRQVRGGGNCSVLAHRIAVVAAAWQAELSDEPPMVPPEALATPEAAAVAKPVKPPPALLHPHFRAEMEVGVSFLPSAGTTLAFALGGGGKWGRFGGQANLWAEGTRTAETTGAPSESFARLGAELGPTLEIRQGQPAIELRAQAVAAALFAGEAVGSDFGADLAGRMLLGSGPVRGFLDLRLLLWPRYFEGQSGPQLSPFEAILTVGIALGGS